MLRQLTYFRLFQWSLLLTMLLIVVTACSPSLSQVLPTAQPPEPTQALLTSLESSAVAAPISISTPILTETISAPAKGGSPTPLLGPTATGVFYTITPTHQANIPGSLRIDYFVTDAVNIKPGDTVVLYWAVHGADTANIYRLNADGEREKVWKVKRAGKMSITTQPDVRNKIQFEISVGDSPASIEQSLTVTIACGDVWFVPLPGDTCPSTPVVQSLAVQQTFQQGLMIWVKTQSRIYVIYKDGKNPTWGYYPDEFKDGQPESDPSITPPSGFLQPRRGFGLIWRLRDGVRKRLGWASGTEASYNGQLQGDATVPGGVMYLQIRENNTLQLNDQGKTWKLLAP